MRAHYLGLLALASAFVVVVFQRLSSAAVQAFLAGPALEIQPHVNKESATLHSSMPFVADLHADVSMSHRDLLARSPDVCDMWQCSRGHVDVPKMLDGNMALQVMTVFSSFPATSRTTGCQGRGGVASLGGWLCLPTFEQNSNASWPSAPPDAVTAIAIFGGRPVRTWWSFRARALYALNRVHEAAARSQGKLRLITRASELRTYYEERKTCVPHCAFTAAVLGLEGAHALEGNLESLGEFIKRGVRYVGSQRFFDNEAGGSMHGEEKRGLTPWGFELVHRMEKAKILVDLTRSSSAVISDVLRVATRPVVVSHTGCRSVCPTNRTLTDGELMQVAKGGGLVGIGFWPGAVCGDGSVGDVVASIVHAIKVAGVNHVALGSDWDGGISPAVDPRGLPAITAGLLDAGVSKEAVVKVLGENAMRLFLQSLPE